jgi:hypothetical protein
VLIFRKILKVGFLEVLKLCKILKVWVFFHSVCCVDLFNHDATAAQRRKYKHKGHKDHKGPQRGFSGEESDLGFEILGIGLGREGATNEHE